MNTVYIALEFYCLPLHTTYLLEPLRFNYIVKWYMKCEHSASEDDPSQTFCFNGTMVKPLKACLQILTMYWTYGKRLLKDVSSGSDFNVAVWARGLEFGQFGKGYSSKVQFDYVSWNLDHVLAAVCPESGQTGIGKKKKRVRCWHWHLGAQVTTKFSLSIKTTDFWWSCLYLFEICISLSTSKDRNMLWLLF